MKVTVNKAPDGVLYMTKDGHGELFSGELAIGDEETFGDNTVELVLSPLKVEWEEQVTQVRFSYVDYLDTANRDVPGSGVRQRFEAPVPGRFDFGPYSVEVTESKKKR